jgi:hypothetical protein
MKDVDSLFGLCVRKAAEVLTDDPSEFHSITKDLPLDVTSEIFSATMEIRRDRVLKEASILVEDEDGLPGTMETEVECKRCLYIDNSVEVDLDHSDVIDTLSASLLNSRSQYAKDMDADRKRRKVYESEHLCI